MLNTMFNTTRKKVVAIAATGFIVFGASNAFGSVGFQSITDFVTNLFNTEKTEMVTQHATEKNTDVTTFNTFLTNLRDEITTAITGHNDTEKARVTEEVNTYQTQLQSDADAQADADVEAKKQELSNTANQKIQESKEALDSKYNELFPTTTP